MADLDLSDERLREIDAAKYFGPVGELRWIPECLAQDGADERFQNGVKYLRSIYDYWAAEHPERIIKVEVYVEAPPDSD